MPHGEERYRKKLQEKTLENPYITLNYKENSGFPGFFPGVFLCLRNVFSAQNPLTGPMTPKSLLKGGNLSQKGH